MRSITSIVDEFHHAAAPSYRELLEHVRPEILLALTATPERSDQLDILHWFGGRTSAEIRLPDAINRRLLCPFQYFGVSDSVDLNGLSWQRGGYRVEELDHLYTGNDVRAGLVLDKVHEVLLNPRQARGLGFCVSKAHAEFMARFFDRHEIPAVALTADSPDELRRSVQEQLRNRAINFIFVVDLYNEGVDIPEVDTVLLLRPTESLTVYLQQLGAWTPPA
jgi:superfamily II DNA or RNA helicase